MAIYHSISAPPRPTPVAAGTRRISVIIPVHNEKNRLPSLLQQLRNDSVEIIVVDGQSTDGTPEAARPWADQVLQCPKAGRAVQMDLGARQASGDILLFLHADTTLPPHWKNLLLAAWKREPKPAATAFGLEFDDPRRAFRMISTLARWRTKYLTGVPHGDQALAVDRRVYLHVGGFPDVPLMEEYYLIRRLKGWGPVRILNEKVKTSARRYDRGGILFTGLRNSALILLFHWGFKPDRLAKYYKSKTY